jgi:hypothetical protein
MYLFEFFFALSQCSLEITTEHLSQHELLQESLRAVSSFTTVCFSSSSNNLGEIVDYKININSHLVNLALLGLGEAIYHGRDV